MTTKKVILITGSGSGIGAAIARELAAPGTCLQLHARGNDAASRQSMQATYDFLSSKGATANIHYADLNDAGSGHALVKQTVDTFGQLDQVVSNAGHASKKSLHEASRQELLAAVENMAGALLEIAQAARPHLQHSPHASIVLTSSFVAHRFRPTELYPLTAAAKAAAEALAMSLAAELAPLGINVNSVVPGYTLKDPNRHAASDWQERLTPPPLGRFGSPEDIAGAVAFLLSEKARYITGQKLAVDGGLCLG